MTAEKLKSGSQEMDHLRKIREMPGIKEKATLLIMNTKIYLIDSKQEKNSSVDESFTPDWKILSPDGTSVVWKESNEGRCWTSVDINENLGPKTSEEMKGESALQDLGSREGFRVAESGRLKRVNYEAIAKRFKIVKSKELAKDSKTELEKPIKEFNFSSKLVKITEEELTGNKPKRTRDWKGRRCGQKKRLQTTSLGKDIAEVMGETRSSGAASSSSESTGNIDEEFGDPSRFFKLEDDLIRCLPEDFFSPKWIAECYSNFDFPTDGLLLSCIGEGGLHQSVANEAGTVFPFGKGGRYRSCFCRRLLCIWREKARILKGLENDRSKAAAEEPPTRNSSSLPLKKRPRTYHPQGS